MTLPIVIFWTILIASFGIFGALYARRYDRPDALIAAYVTLAILAGIAASKTVAFDLGVIRLFAPGGVLLFSATFLLTDIVNERFGRKETERMIAIALVCQIAFIAFTYLILSAEYAPFFTGQAAFETVLSTIPRIAIAGLITFYISEMLDARLFAWIREKTKGRHVWMRSAFSSLPAMFVDSVLFVLLAFYGVMPVVPLIIGLTAMKWIVGILDIPFLYIARALLRTKA